MVKDDDIKVVILQWLTMTPDEQNEVKREAANLLEKALIFWKEPPLSPGLEHILNSIEEMSIETAQYLREPEAVYAVQKAYLQWLLSPENLAWEQACQHLKNALDDPVVQRNPVTFSLIKEAQHIALDGWLNPEEENLFYYWKKQGERQAATLRGKHAAKSKNLEPRAWVLIKWAGRPDKAQSKAAFARQYAALVKSKFDLIVTPVTIERSWLPKV